MRQGFIAMNCLVYALSVRAVQSYAREHRSMKSPDVVDILSALHLAANPTTAHIERARIQAQTPMRYTTGTIGGKRTHPSWKAVNRRQGVPSMEEKEEKSDNKEFKIGDYQYVIGLAVFVLYNIWCIVNPDSNYNTM
mmetsp:Transcript_85877/g.135602  ORF Transcript_85877/g.135602 Transcript_85877/m.135602 type:complete len:137 (-) Transcript_85877:120-530(-)|eukprot:CAMPEP_0169131796 /NCGR_PEP_ID=MMETSP1015-20121227/38446_1 /TAXON_ID=342587 /ORGANISM="Karlodinium micrum, Strain CCMP2283" /LENGTH=136 /DNA_ID=CAMNT_0009196097 /DNA_START=53 /DNA_END=463 /DNA_ORIENTATION=-